MLIYIRVVFYHNGQYLKGPAWLAQMFAGLHVRGVAAREGQLELAECSCRAGFLRLTEGAAMGYGLASASDRAWAGGLLGLSTVCWWYWWLCAGR